MVQTSTIRSGLGRAVMTQARILRIGVIFVLLTALPLSAGAATSSIPALTSTTSDEVANSVVTVSSAPTVSEVTTGEEHSCARLNDGTVYCWGVNGSGQLGDGTRIDRATPGLVTGLAGLFVDAISAGGEFTCALIGDGRVYCWGDNSNGQLGNGTTTDSLTPSPVTGLTTAIAVSAGAAHACALLLAGTEIRCWGSNGSGQLGDTTTTQRLTPVTVSGLTNASQVSAGGAHTCAGASDGIARCWGDNTFGQLGDTTTTNRSAPVTVDIPNSETVLRVASGNSHSCELRFDSTVSCWGFNGNGRLGDNTTTDRLTPVAVSGLTNATQIATGDNHSCAVLDDTTAKCWGFNGNGRLGDGTTTERLTPVTVSGLTNVTQIAAGGGHTCARRSDGTAWCWGTNASGELGDGTTTDRSTPVRVTGFDGSTVPPPDGVVGASLALACSPDALRVGTLVTCTITGGDPDVDILWRAAYNPVFAGAGITLDQDGSGTFTFTVPRAALGSSLTVELVEWTVPLDLGTVAGPVPASVPAGGGAPPVLMLTVFGVLVLVALREGRRPAAERPVRLRW